jgi:NAD-dependent SIR2 family protein deacetylase
MALVELQNRGFLKYLVSQNCDGLHRRSGILPVSLLQLHRYDIIQFNDFLDNCRTGYLSCTVTATASIARTAERNTFVVRIVTLAPSISSCLHLHLRSTDFRAVATYEKTVHDHRTGRKCARCDGVLLDSIINFGEPLPEKHIQSAFDHAKKADLCLVLGSSLTVTPANEVPEVVGQRRNAKLVICNLQKTPLDPLSELRIYSKTDELMIRVMEKLDIPIPPFILHRRLVVELETKEGTTHQLTVYGVDVDSTPVTFLCSVKLEHKRRVARSEPFVINFRGELDSGTQLKLELEFMGHYGEPNVEIIYEYHNEHDKQTLYLLEYNPYTGEWKTSKQDSLTASDKLNDDTETKPSPAANALPDVSVIDLTE